MRLFTALELPADARTALARWGARACAGDPALRPVGAAALHVTLHFLGERPDGEAGALGAAVAAAPDAPIPLTAGGALWLSPRRPHVLTCALSSDGQALALLHARLGRALAAAAPGWAPDARALRPHVTVARVRRGERPRREGLPACPELRFDAVAVTLQQSVLAPSGARYATLERRVLRSGA